MVGTGDINTTNIKTNSSAGTQSRDPKIALDQRASVYPDEPVHYYPINWQPVVKREKPDEILAKLN